MIVSCRLQDWLTGVRSWVSVAICGGRTPLTKWSARAKSERCATGGIGDAFAAAGASAGFGPGRYSHSGKTEFKTTRMITIPMTPAMKYRYQFTPVPLASRRHGGGAASCAEGNSAGSIGWKRAGVGAVATRGGAWTATGAAGSTVIACQLGNSV